MTATQPPSLQIDPYALDVILDPYGFHEVLRDTAPVVHLAAHDVYAVGRYEEAVAVLTDCKRFSTTGGVGLGDARKPGANFRPLNRLLEVDPPDHTALRRVANRILSPQVVRGWRAGMLEDAHLLVDKLLQMGSVDGVEDMAEAFVFHVFPKSIGVRFDRDAILAIGDMSFNQSGPVNDLYLNAMARAQPYLKWFEESQQRENVKPGSIADQFFEAERAGDIAEGLASNLVRTLVRGGMDSTIAAVGATLRHLTHNPDQWAYLKSNREKIRTAFDEAVRLDTPFQMTYRVTTEATELSGCRLEADKKIGVFMGSANRDPRKWQHPERYDVSRQVTGHVGFGTADHNCIGQMLARLEAESLLTALLDKVETLEPAGEPRFRPVNQMRTLAHLPIVLRPAGSPQQTRQAH